jgi:DNA helicase-2/ATP-dependent DNA helicase PcrA
MTVSTIHGAKGTEYQVVYVMACEERALPSGFALDAADPAALEEERRLAYIAMTRAREDVICTTVSERVGDRGDLRRPSRFLAEAGL